MSIRFALALVLLVAPFSGLMPAQELLFGKSKAAPANASSTLSKSGPHVGWKVRLEPAEVKRGARAEIVASYETAPPDWHIYAPDFKGTGIPTTIKVDSPSIRLLGKPSFPPPVLKEEPALGETQRLLVGKGDIRQAFYVLPEAKPGDLTIKLEIGYQACNESGCDLPKTDEFTVTLKVSDAPAETPPAEPKPVAAADVKLEAMGFVAFILVFVGGGLLALIMPCTYPMIPLTISFFTKQADARKGKVLPLALAYGGGIILVFNLIGWLGWALAKGWLGALDTSRGPETNPILDFAADPWVNLFFGVAFIVFALSFLGLFEIRLPSVFNRLASRAGGASSYLGVFALGTTLVITSFTCTAPVVGSLLVVAAKGGDFGRISLGMSVFGTTLAAPFVLLSLFPSRMKQLPRAGEWMHTLKVSLGFLELVAALKFLSQTDLAWHDTEAFLPRELFLLLWAAICLVAGLYLLAIFRLRDEAGAGIGSLRMLFGLLTIIAAFYFFFGAMGYQLDFITESLVPPYHSGRAVQNGSLQGSAEKTPWTLVADDLERGLKTAKEEGKRAFINFTGIT